jgi:hypothetical protein
MARVEIGVPATPNDGTLASPSPPARKNLNYFSDTLLTRPQAKEHHADTITMKGAVFCRV